MSGGGPAPLLAALARHAESAPATTALVAGDQRLRYGELYERVLRAIGGLRAHGIRPGDLVGVVGHKTTEAVVALLGVLGAGAAYVPLDPRAPAARSAELVRDAHCPLVINGAGPSGPPTPPLPVDEDDIAYCMYTSGSTGRPKGVRIPHRAIRAFFEAVTPLLGIGPGARCLNTSALHFDVSVVDLLLPLYRGATVHLGPIFPAPPTLVDLIERERITHLAMVGSTLALVAQHSNGFRGRNLTSLRRVMTGAEILDPRAVQSWLAAAPDLVVINGYGPTEATCLVVAQPIVEREPDRTTSYPIGTPLAGVRIGFQIPDGRIDDTGPGEILIAGDQVMAGYLRRPEEEAMAFLYRDGTWFYRTGDRGRRRPDGVILFEGRRDDEVKIRGYRVNLNEVRRSLESHRDVGRAFVAVITDSRGAPALSCAIAPPASPAGPEPALLTALDADRVRSIRDHVVARLPGYMVPAAFHLLARVPVLPSGKPDAGGIRECLRAAADSVLVRR